MTRASLSERMRRMELIAVRLKQDLHCTAGELAQEFGVSQRTIARDLALMREQGMQIDADRGRGGGLRLDRNWGVGRLNLSYAEAVDLLISIAVAQKMNSPLFLANLGSVERQLIASFSPEKRSKVKQLKSRILVGVTASTFVQASANAPAKRVVQTIHQAFLDQDSLQIEYQREDGQTSNRLIEPHYLLLKYPIWYIAAFDHLRQAPRSFRCDRVWTAQATGSPFRLRPVQEFGPDLARGELSV